MNQEETLNLWANGRRVWNLWARNILDQRRKLEGKSEWGLVTDTQGNQVPQNQKTKQWMDDATVIFSGSFAATSSDHIIDFSELVFPYKAVFRDVHFQNEVSFWSAYFHGQVTFERCTFQKTASISNVKFHSNAQLVNTVFLENTSFDKSVFEHGLEITNVLGKGLVSFKQCDINAITTAQKTRFEGKVDFSSTEFHSIAWFDTSEFLDVAYFRDTTFHKQARFPEVQFSKSARFDRTTFKQNALFTNASFGISAVFNGAKFEKSAWFQQTKWKNKIQFHGVDFLGEVNMNGAIFDGNVWFNSCLFAKPVQLTNSRFISSASFNSAQIRQAFDLSGVRFGEVPDFKQTHCEEAPLLDDVQIASAIVEQRKFLQKPDFTISANYRALKRLAIQAHDHKHEVDFFAEELKTRRLMVYRPSDPNWWLSFLFEELSDYGRSIVRPLMYWLGVVMLSAVHYIAMATPLAPDRTTECLAGAGSQVNTAYQLAFAKGLLVPGLADRTIVTQAYDCLFGDIIPGSATIVASIQTLLSAILLFLLLLGIRNRFKLK